LIRHRLRLEPGDAAIMWLCQVPFHGFWGVTGLRLNVASSQPNPCSELTEHPLLVIIGSVDPGHVHGVLRADLMLDIGVIANK